MATPHNTYAEASTYKESGRSLIWWPPHIKRILTEWSNKKFPYNDQSNKKWILQAMIQMMKETNMIYKGFFMQWLSYRRILYLWRSLNKYFLCVMAIFIKWIWRRRDDHSISIVCVGWTLYSVSFCCHRVFCIWIDHHTRVLVLDWSVEAIVQVLFVCDVC